MQIHVTKIDVSAANIIFRGFAEASDQVFPLRLRMIDGEFIKSILTLSKWFIKRKILVYVVTIKDFSINQILRLINFEGCESFSNSNFCHYMGSEFGKFQPSKSANTVKSPLQAALELWPPLNCSRNFTQNIKIRQFLREIEAISIS